MQLKAAWQQMETKAGLIAGFHIQGSKKPPFGRPGQVDFPFGQVTFSPSLPDEQVPRQSVRRLNFC